MSGLYILMEHMRLSPYPSSDPVRISLTFLLTFRHRRDPRVGLTRP
jgi:hypothetical protein